MVTLPCLFFFFFQTCGQSFSYRSCYGCCFQLQSSEQPSGSSGLERGQSIGRRPLPPQKKKQKKKQDICSDGAQDVHLECTSDPHRALCIEDVGMKYSLHSCLVEVCKLGCGCKNFLCMWGIVCLIF